MASKKQKRAMPPQKMPKDARERLAGLMLEALDFGGTPEPKPKLRVKQYEDLARGRASGATTASNIVAEDLRKLIRGFLAESRNGYFFDAETNERKDARGIDAILEDWRDEAEKVQEGQRTSVAVYARFMEDKPIKTDHEKRVLSLYDALGGPFAERADKDSVKRVRTVAGEMSVDVLINLYKRAATILDEINLKADSVKKRVNSGGAGKNKREALVAAQTELEKRVDEMFT
jgi:hypothetical protein